VVVARRHAAAVDAVFSSDASRRLPSPSSILLTRHAAQRAAGGGVASLPGGMRAFFLARVPGWRCTLRADTAGTGVPAPRRCCFPCEHFACFRIRRCSRQRWFSGFSTGNARLGIAAFCRALPPFSDVP